MGVVVKLAAAGASDALPPAGGCFDVLPRLLTSDSFLTCQLATSIGLADGMGFALTFTVGCGAALAKVVVVLCGLAAACSSVILPNSSILPVGLVLLTCQLATLPHAVLVEGPCGSCTAFVGAASASTSGLAKKTTNVHQRPHAAALPAAAVGHHVLDGLI